jgi:hypothetical protein
VGDPDPAVLELLRERSGLSIDRDGRFLHRGEPITHARTLEVLWGSLERNPQGRYQVRVGREIGYVTVEDDPYGVRGVTWGDAGRSADVHLTDGTVERLDAASLSIDREGVLHCRVKRGAHRARFSRAAQVTLGLALLEDPRSPGAYRLKLGDEWFEVAAG